jgi:hypothetical protein
MTANSLLEMPTSPFKTTKMRTQHPLSRTQELRPELRSSHGSCTSTSSTRERTCTVKEF